jgi:hypothetical protein
MRFDTQEYLQEDNIQKKEINMLEITMADVICPLEIIIAGKDKPYYPVDTEIVINNVEFKVLSNRSHETMDGKRQEITIILKAWK